MDVKLWTAILSALGIVLAGGAFLAWSVVTGFRQRAKIANEQLAKSQGDVEGAHSELIKVLEMAAGAWKKRYEDEHKEFTDYRQLRHDADQVTNAKILRQTEELAELKGKTDLTPVIRFHQEQVQINAKVVESLDAILGHLKQMSDSRATT